MALSVFLPHNTNKKGSITLLDVIFAFNAHPNVLVTYNWWRQSCVQNEEIRSVWFTIIRRFSTSDTKYTSSRRKLQFELFSELERSQWKFIGARRPSNIQTVRNSNSKRQSKNLSSFKLRLILARVSDQTSSRIDCIDWLYWAFKEGVGCKSGPAVPNG